MTEQRVQRRLAAILVADVVGYSRLMRDDEAKTLMQLKTLRLELFDPKVKEYGGRIVKTTGDGVLVEFPSAVDAVQHAVDVQQGMAHRNRPIPRDRRMELRIGINLGDVLVEGDDLYGDGINIAARLEALAEPGGICVSAMVYEEVRHKLKIGFTDLGERSVKSIADPLHVYAIRPDEADGTGTSPGLADALFSRPAVAVLPFENLSGDPDQEHFADGLSEDIITALSLWRSFPVISRSSTFAYKGQRHDVRKVAAELSARYVLEGSVRRGRDRVRVTAQLIDAQSGHHVWAHKYDRDLTEIFDLQDELTRQIVGVVAPAVMRAEQNRLVLSRPRSLDAWECVQRGMAYLRSYDRESTAHARRLFERAIERDPTYSRGYLGLAFSHHREVQFLFAETRAASVEKCVLAARRAVELDEADAFAHWELGIAHLFAGDNDKALAESRLAVELNPIYANAHVVVGLALVLLGRPDEGISHLETWAEWNLHDPANSINLGHVATAYFAARRYDDAAILARKSIERRADNPQPHIILAASLAHLGHPREAREALGKFEDLRPGFAQPSEWWFKFSRPEDNEHLLNGLRKAGLPAKVTRRAGRHRASGRTTFP
jgi:adenylate cyclase